MAHPDFILGLSRSNPLIRPGCFILNLSKSIVCLLTNFNIPQVFGGSSVNGAFNDLWCFDLSKREWHRPISMGNYPNPKACCSLVQYKRKMVLFGGWRQTTGMTHQPHLLFNELHVYDIDERRWMVKNFTYGPNALAAHTASVHADKMVVFGGFSALDNDGQGPVNDVWILDLRTFVWKRPKILDHLRPAPRYGHFQVAMDEQHLLVLGGCGGPNNMFHDAWVLDMSNEIWKWQQIVIKNKKSGVTHFWSRNPACVIDKKLVVLGPMPSSPVDLETCKPLLNNRLLPPAIEVRNPRFEPNDRLRPRPHEQRPQLVDNQNVPLIPPNNEPNRNNYNEAAIRFHKSLVLRNWDSQLPRRFNEPVVHGRIKMAAFSVENNSSLPQTIQRERQLENLRRMEQKLQRQREQSRREEEIQKVKRARTNCVAVFVCDLTKFLDGGIEWLQYKNSGLYENAPEKMILSSLVAGTGELIVFGGLKKEATTENATNSVFFLTVPETLI